MLLNLYAGKKVLITGHTGFKGSWLATWLLKLGADVTGFSDGIPTKPSLFEDAELQSRLKHIVGDVTDFNHIHQVISEIQPDFVFHLAAQAIVSVSYDEPLRTMDTNFMGTVNVLESLRKVDCKCIAVIITSDKCYENVEWLWGYKETDALGGRDIYSASKGAAEVAFHGYFSSFFNKTTSNVRLATGRAGNVIGGGDWARDRIVVDCMKSWRAGKPVEIRSPKATRPWQHVLEPLSGYLTLGVSLYNNINFSGESFNFGPLPEKSHTVVDLLSDLAANCSIVKDHVPYLIVDQIPFHEAGLLRLNCDKAIFKMNWEASLKYKECVSMVAEWYEHYFNSSEDIYELTIRQISEYEAIARDRGVVWARS